MDRRTLSKRVECRLYDRSEIEVMARCSKLLPPGGFDLADSVECLADEVLSFCRQGDNPRSSVGGIGPALEMPSAFQGVHELAH